MRQSNYFYAAGDAALYDATVKMTDRAYGLIHEATIQCLRRWLNRQAKLVPHIPLWLLDVGCGTGTEAIQVLSTISNCRILGIDHSAAMLSCFRAKVTEVLGAQCLEKRLALAQLDFRTTGWIEQAITLTKGAGVPAAFASVLSVYALHHLKPDEKRYLYQELHAHMEPGSLFINSDLFTFGSPWLAAMAQDEEESWINAQFDEGTGADEILGSDRERLRDAWIEHLREDNIPIPVTCEDGAIVSEVKLLHEAGFRNVEVPIRLYQSALLTAER